MGGASNKLQDLNNRLYERAGAYVMQVSTEKSKIMVKSTANTSADINLVRSEKESPWRPQKSPD
ncbi:hypothetical protein DPMN_192450 [Dreissena polymorpha]|uniref:Uncharacterized protein n=1 Tax=Dreissena polymorpha TaxID=45954 RepID=A0A9D4BFN0_DREPO|nr:hypothetical protein DPMN_192450 [Dreissena polymorpha]